jgi:hypothetical protein
MVKSSHRAFLAAGGAFLGVSLLLPLAAIVLSAEANRQPTRAEVFHAIESFYDDHQSGTRVPFAMNALDFGSLPRIVDGDANCKVISARFDRATGRELFRLLSASSPVPFEVPVKMSTPAGVPMKSPRVFSAPQARQYMVDPRHFARLRLVSRDSEMFLEVRPLQKGDCGEVVRVRMPKNGKTFSARVTGPNSLQAEF